MGCNCGGRPTTGSAMALRNSSPRPNERGMYDLASAPGCAERYDGLLANASIYVIGRGTEHEKLFVKRDRIEALRYARTVKPNLTVDHLLATDLCREPVLALLGA